MIRAVLDLLDTLIFLWLAVKGLFFIWVGGGGYPIFWGCALVCTAVYWRKMEKERAVHSVEHFFTLLKR